MIKIMDGTDRFPLQKIGYNAGICWNSPVDDVDRNIRRAKECLENGHGRVLEFVDVEMTISDYSARVIREWYTHIGGSPTRLQESTRYVDANSFTFVVPPTVNDDEKRSVYLDCMDDIRKAYGKLIELGVPREDCAMVLPLGMTTKIVDKRNLRNLMEMSHQRLCVRAYWEYRKLMSDITVALYEISDEWKWIIDNFFQPKCDVTGRCPEKKSCGRRPSR